MTITTSLDDLAAICEGRVLQAGDDGYDEVCACWNLAWTHRPAVVVQAAGEADVVYAVRHAAARGWAVAVQTTGHGVTVPADEHSLLLVTGALDRVRIDPVSRTAAIGGGITWTSVLAAAQEQQLAPLLGSAPHVGAVGYSLGGGFGWLARAYGLAVDSIRSLRVVLADGRVITTSPQDEPELFWAMCGTTGSALGVVVEMTVALHPVDQVYGGDLFYALPDAREVFEFYGDWINRAPSELTSAFNITAFPPLEMVPEPLRGQTFAIVRGCFAGEMEAGRELVDQWRSWRTPLMDTWAPMPFSQVAQISMDPVDPVPAASSGRWLATLGPQVPEVMLEAIAGPSPMLFAEVRHAGGAIRRDNPAVSFAARDARYCLELVGMIPSAEADAELERRFEHAWRRLAPHLSDLCGYLNFAEGTERVQLAARAFPAETQARLAAAKRRYDPDDVFRHSISLTAPVR
ncbi:FAD-binding oxidoreductase [Ruania rhizosphaerae]|uniref:FAD-binding oxidoreductase n=1 Tax=Ruania rhizosphaerae TaxID=1840413 RepID=UPI00135B48F4|nr:FAD-binding oxidoreductase [Ruania rhizosphaerae]